MVVHNPGHFAFVDGIAISNEGISRPAEKHPHQRGDINDRQEQQLISHDILVFGLLRGKNYTLITRSNDHEQPQLGIVALGPVLLHQPGPCDLY